MGYLYTIIASVMYGVGPIFVTFMQDDGWSSPAALLVTNIVAVFLLAGIILINRQSFKLKKGQLFSVVALGGVSYWGMGILLNTSYNYLYTGLATMCHFVYPAIVMVIMTTIFKEKIAKTKVICLALSLIGIFLIVGKDGASIKTGVGFGVCFAVASGVLYAIYIVSTDKSAIKDINGFVAAFYVFLTGAVLSSIHCTLPGVFIGEFSLSNCLCAVAFPLTSVIAIVCLTKGVSLVGATYAAIINMLEPAVSMVVSLIVLGSEDVSILAFAGCALILISILIISLPKKAIKTKI